MTDTLISNDIFSLTRGSTPLLLSMPHTGNQLPSPYRERMVERAWATEDTDWHMEALYGFARDLGASVLVPRYSRFVVDLNRPPENTPMYPGANNTGLCPLHFFTGDPIYRDGQAPDDADIAARVARFWRPYHQALQDELERLRAQHGYALLFDAHSIKSQLPWLFEGELPALNLGTVNGSSCSPALRDRLMQVLAAQDRFSHVTDGRFKGGYITRQYGRPQQGIHAVQLEKCWRSYMDERTPSEWRPDIAAQLQPLLRTLLQTMLAWQPD